VENAMVATSASDKKKPICDANLQHFQKLKAQGSENEQQNMGPTCIES